MTLLRAAFVSLRPHQWTKNLLVFAALAFSKHLFEPDPLLRTVLAFSIFCGLSGAVYLVNDVADLERDRLHPRKRLRPLASGALGARAAVAIAAGLGRSLPRPRPPPGAALPGLLRHLPAPEPRLFLPPQERGDPRRHRHQPGLRPARLGGGDGDLGAHQRLAARLHPAPRPLPRPLQAAARARLPLGRGERAPGHPRRVQPLPPRPDDRGGHGLVPHGLLLLHHGPGDHREVQDRPAVLDHPLRALRHLPLSLSSASEGTGGQPHRRAPDRPAAPPRRLPLGRGRGGHRLQRSRRARAARASDP